MFSLEIYNKVKKQIRLYKEALWYYKLSPKNRLQNFSYKWDRNKRLDSSLFELLNYFYEAHENSSSKNGCFRWCGGLPSCYGRFSDAVEPVSRLMPLFAAAMQIDDKVLLEFGVSRSELASSLDRVFSNAPLSRIEGGWGEGENYSQLIIEVSDIALSIWMTRNDIWNYYSDSKKNRIIRWLDSYSNLDHLDTNWNFFPLIIDLVISDLIGREFRKKNKLDRLLSFYVGDGWFKDGEEGDLDLYNAWAFHYYFFWILQIRSDLLPTSYYEDLKRFNSLYAKMFGVNGFALFGRSPCYRIALPVPLLAQEIIEDSRKDSYMPRSNSLALKALHVTLDSYLTEGSCDKGLLSLGVFGEQPEFSDQYSSAGSPFWGLRSLVLYFYGYSAFVGVTEGKLPVERASYDVSSSVTKMRVQGNFETGSAELILPNGLKEVESIEIRKYGMSSRFLSTVFCRAIRPDNNRLSYVLKRVSSQNDLYKNGG